MIDEDMIGRSNRKILMTETLEVLVTNGKIHMSKTETHAIVKSKSFHLSWKYDSFSAKSFAIISSTKMAVKA